MFIENAVWCLEAGGKTICSSSSNNGRMRRGLRQIVGRAVAGVHLTDSLYSLELKFESNERLKVSCDPVNSEKFPDYSLHTHNSTCTVGPGGKITREKIIQEMHYAIKN